MVPNNAVAAPWPVPLSPTEAHSLKSAGQNPADWMAFVVQVPAEGIGIGEVPGSEIIIVQATSAIPASVIETKRRLVQLPENVPPIDIGGVSVRLLIRSSGVVEAMRVPDCEGWRVTIDWTKVSVEMTAEQDDLLYRYGFGDYGSLRTLTMHEAQAIQAYFPGATVSPIVRSTSLPTEPPSDEAAAAAPAAQDPASAVVELAARTEGAGLPLPTWSAPSLELPPEEAAGVAGYTDAAALADAMSGRIRPGEAR